MGNEPSRVLSPRVAPPHALELLRSDASVQRALLTSGDGYLALEDAWEIATAWRHVLVNRVCLVTDSNGPKCSIVESYSWVRFNIDVAKREEASQARAAALTWIALARCPGYSGRENPVFWRCVFSAYITQTMPSARLQYHTEVQSINDAIGFFDQPGVIFPRFMLCTRAKGYTEDYAAGVRLFCGLPGEQLHPDVEWKLNRLEPRIPPFVEDTHMPRQVQVPVCLAGLQAYQFTVAAWGRPYVPLGPILDQLIPAVNASAASATAKVSSHHFHIHGIEFAKGATVRTDAEVDLILGIIRRGRVSVKLHDWYDVHQSEISLTARTNYVRCLLGLSSQRTQARVTAVQLSSLHLPAFMSALPFVTQLHSVFLRSDDGETQFNEADLPWIAYALFHPDTKTSTWRSLLLDNASISEQSVFVLRTMARGNNLLSILNHTTPTSDAYYGAELVPGAVVKTEPRDGADDIPHNTQRLDVCGVSSIDSTTWSKWVAVVVPVYGLAWIRSQDLVNVEARSPSSSALSSLTLWNEGSATGADTNLLPEFIAPLGSGLRYLNIAKYCEFESTSSLRDILELCPLLSTLVVTHAGQLWSDSTKQNGLGDLLPRLRELELHIPPTQNRLEIPSIDHMHSTLSKLETLRIQPANDDQYAPSRDAIVAILSNALRLRYIHWQHGLIHVTSQNLPESYPETRAWTEKVLREFKWPNDRHLFVDELFTPACAAAFLSVATAESKRSTAVSRLDRDVVASIFQFVSSCQRRMIAVEPMVAQIRIDPSRMRRAPADSVRR